MAESNIVSENIASKNIEPATITAILEKLYANQVLTLEESETLFTAVVLGEMDPIVLSSVLTALKIRGEQPDEIAGAAQALLAAALPFPAVESRHADCCGTGGDNMNTINISTTAAFVAAACGLKMTKHGNRSVSSKSGSSDLLEAFGINLTQTPEQAKACLDELGICFLFAPQYHAGIRHAIPVRQALKTRTIFNVLGPLLNPTRPQVQLMGVYDECLIRPIAETMDKLGVQRALVVHGSGLDEIALHGETKVAELNNGMITEFTISPADFGVERYDVAELRGGDAAENKVIIERLLSGNGTDAQKAAVAINVSALLVVAEIATDFKHGTELAMAAIDDGRALALILQLAVKSQQV
ncbi:anthranilate phosphoribosyltransferase [Moritella viscosa]|uniref:Anthranilate phosphoribosyltransferase n=1 Tax=Moritella viscosa TaxID=80854 RepID=A0A1L0AJ58_9GAMM|nr:anthranilate phosphoribosyltransferase [Moritella viscosa]SGZ17177.1 Anthranilate phosphoribosyltransferase [Moritella viscosa]SHN99108.1 Anthranilate phosphoribosyltransferase [Moritella viscosa]SHN99109.1 Anthranilate phosphoribosyltransferase [Moritella viscosa]SHO00210.1 Anthranilate phosphoribosyltransferase [Moritella viscosa]SHO01329.1 Anthranilate phosphoribosyltransferase [Moritella viscosa]